MRTLRDKLLVSFDAEYREHLAAVRAMLDAWQGAGAAAPLDLVEIHRRLHSLKGAARVSDLGSVERLAHELESLIEALQRGAPPLDAAMIERLRGALDAIEDEAVQALAAAAPSQAGVPGAGLSGPDETGVPAAAAVAPGQIPPPSQAPLRIIGQDLDAIVQVSADILSSLPGGAAVAGEIRAARLQLNALTALVGGRGARVPARGEALADRLRQVGTMLAAAERRQREQAWRLRQMGRGLQDRLGQVQTIRAEDVFGGARKAVRDLARDEGKQVQIVLHGLDVLADRSILQQLKDPVLHLLRNAVHHGLESPGERAAQGKPAEGQVSLDIATRGAELVVSVTDDGRGIDRERVMRAARARGLIDGEALDGGDPGLLAELLVHPGLSTAPRVTEVAGRGIGLSVVAEAARQMGGAFSIRAAGPSGTRAEIAVPASALVLRFALFEAAGDLAALPLGRILRFHHLPAAQIQDLAGALHAVEPGHPPMALASLAALLGWGEGAAAPAEGRLTVIELKAPGLRFGLVVDRIVELRDATLRRLDLDPEGAGCAAGGLALEGGAVVPVLEAGALLARYLAAGPGSGALLRRGQPAPRRRSILIVDDSITTRTLEQSLLEASGYEVHVSADGADALTRLRRDTIDLVISDVEMPLLDGFGLLAAVRKEPELARLPFILVTSRNDEADRRRGLTLGANAYVIKQRFNQVQLLETIGRLI